MSFPDEVRHLMQERAARKAAGLSRSGSTLAPISALSRAKSLSASFLSCSLCTLRKPDIALDAVYPEGGAEKAAQTKRIAQLEQTPAQREAKKAASTT